MKENEIIVGLDIGTTKIAAIAGRKNEYGKIEILGSGKTESKGVKRGVVTNIDNTVSSIQKAVKEAEQKSNVNIKSVTVGIAGQHIKSTPHRGSLVRENSEEEVTQEEIDNLTNDMYRLSVEPGETIINVIPQEYYVDKNSTDQPKGVTGSMLEANFQIITAQLTAAKNIRRCVEKAGLDVDNELVLEPIASAEAVLSEEEKEAGVVLVDIGGGTTDLALFKDGIIQHTDVIPFGGDIVTEDIKTGCNIIKKHAEDLKVKFGSALANQNKEEEIVAIPGLRGRPPKEITLKNLAGIIQARMEEIIEYVQYEIKDTKLENQMIAGIVLTGGGSQLKHIKQLTEYITGMDTRIGYPNEHLAKEVPEEVVSPMYATGIGLVIMGIYNTEKKQYKSKKHIGTDKKSEGFFTMMKRFFGEDE